MAVLRDLAGPPLPVLARAGATARTRQLALGGVGLAILALALYFHSYRLGATPGWDPQEGYTLDLAWNLAHGRLRLFALTSAFAQHPPLFYLQLVLAIRVFGYGIVAVRALAGMYAVLTCAALLLVGRRLLGAGPALWAALAFTVAPIMLANTRWGYTYAQLAFVGVLCLWATWRYSGSPRDFSSWESRGWLLAAAALAGLATLSDYEGIAWVLVVALVALRRNWRDAALATGVGLALPVAGLLACLAAAPAVFLADFTTTLGRASGGNPVLQGVMLLVNYYRLATVDVWLTLGMVGLFLVPARVRSFIFGVVAVLALVVLKARDIGLSIHTAVPLLPLLALGVGMALHTALRRLYIWSIGWLAPVWLAAQLRLRALPMRSVQHAGVASPSPAEPLNEHTAPRAVRLAAATIVFLVVVSPVGVSLASDAAGLASTLPTRQDELLATPNDADATARYVFTHARAGDLVLASPEIAWMFDQPAAPAPATFGADLLQTLAVRGQAASFYPAGLPASRWAYDTSLGRARYVVVDNLIRRLTKPDQIAALKPVVEELQRWPAVYTSGQYTVYERPA